MCQIVQKYFSISKASIFDSVWTWILAVQTAYNCSPYYIPDYFRVGRRSTRTIKRFTSVKHSWFWTIKCEELTCAVAEALERDSVLVARVPTVCLHQTWNGTAWPFFFFFNFRGCLTPLETAFSWLYSFHSPEPPYSYHLISVHNTPGTVLRVCRTLTYIILTEILCEILLKLPVCR